MPVYALGFWTGWGGGAWSSAWRDRQCTVRIGGSTGAAATTATQPPNRTRSPSVGPSSPNADLGSLAGASGTALRFNGAIGTAYLCEGAWEAPNVDKVGVATARRPHADPHALHGSHGDA